MGKKLLSVAVPCYNSAAYMEKCIDSILVGGEEVEILIVNDGSFKDNTAEIADRYAREYPTICKAIHKENGGHGSAVNAGLENATGLYYKVVDSDDWLDPDAYRAMLDKIREFVEKDEYIDVFLANFVYEKEGAKHKKVMRMSWPADRVFTWSDIKHFYKGQYLLMHSVIYRVDLLREECHLELPKHTFYVDDIYVYKPLPYVKSMYYLNVDLYRYFIGRDDQSVNEKVMISRIDQQLRVNKIMIEDVALWDVKNKKCQKYMFNYLEIITIISTVLLIKSGTKEHLQMKKDLWIYLKEYDLKLYKKLRKGIMGFVMNLPGWLGRKIAILGYSISQKFFGFN